MARKPRRESQLKTLQSDGYNVYMYLDNTTDRTEYLCCLAHLWVKFKYASERGGDKDADYFLDALENFTGWKPNMRKAS